MDACFFKQCFRCWYDFETLRYAFFFLFVLDNPSKLSVWIIFIVLLFIFLIML